MIERAIGEGAPFGWVAADSVYGVGDKSLLRRAGKGYVLGVNATPAILDPGGRRPPVAVTAEAIAQGLDASAWRRLSAGEGTKGARLADLDAREYDDTRTGLWTRGLPIRCTISDGDLAFFSTGPSSVGRSRKCAGSQPASPSGASCPPMFMSIMIPSEHAHSSTDVIRLCSG